MLVLSRRRSEEIVLLLPSGEQIVVRVCDIHHGGTVRIGITAPKEIEIYRPENREHFLKGTKPS